MCLAPSSFDALTDSMTELNSAIYKNVPIIGNAGVCVDSLYTTGRAGINFYVSPNPLAKTFFGVSAVCGVVGATASGTALVTSFAGIPVTAWVGSFGARIFNRLGKYALHMGNVTNGNITNATEISDLIF